MADVVSRAFKNGKFFEASHNLVAYFNKHFPLPKSTSWTEFHLPKELSSPVIACLLGKQQHLASLLRLMKHGKNIGESGQGTQRCATSTLSSHKSPSHQCNATSSQELLLLGSGVVCSASESKSRLEASRKLSPPSQRPLSWLDNPAPCTEPTKSTSCQLKDKWRATDD